VRENLAVAARKPDKGASKHASNHAPWTVDTVFTMFPRLSERRDQMAAHLSGGEQQMLATARALMTNPDLLLLDEPLEGLAPIIVEELSAAIRRMASEQGMAFILVEQHAEIALSLTDHAIVIERGNIVHRAPSQALLNDQATLDRLIGLKVSAAD
jgi:branched-chain amino acid transport system ATP-binding protein